jgi:hypothetical protein
LDGPRPSASLDADAHRRKALLDAPVPLLADTLRARTGGGGSSKTTPDGRRAASTDEEEAGSMAACGGMRDGGGTGTAGEAARGEGASCASK